MKRTIQKHWFLLGIIGVLTAAMALPNTRSLIIGFGEAKYVEWRLAQIRPQNERQLWNAYNEAVTLGARHYSIFKFDGRRAVYRWTRNSDGQMKSWVDPRDEQLLVSSLNGDAWPEDCTIIFRTGYTADFTWRYRRWRIWAEGGATLLSGAVMAWLGFFVAYGLFIGLMAWLLVWGKASPLPTPINPGSEPSIHVVHGGDAPHHLVHQDAPAASPQDGWLVVWAMLFTVMLRDRRWIVRGIRTMSSRAPPLPKGAVSC